MGEEEGFASFSFLQLKLPYPYSLFLIQLTSPSLARLICNTVRPIPSVDDMSLRESSLLVRLGKSGLKVSRIILGMMTYGSAEWQPWVRDEELGMEHVKAACVIFYCSQSPSDESRTQIRYWDSDVRYGECRR